MLPDPCVVRVPADVAKDVDAKEDVVRDTGGELLYVDFVEELRALYEFGDGGVEGSGNLLDDRVRLGMDGGAVEGVLAVSNAKEASGLLEGFGPDNREPC